MVYSTGTEPKWVSVALNAPFVRWRIGHDAFIGAANLVGDPTRVQTEVLPNFYARFGRETVSRWFGRDMGCIELVESPGEPPYYDEVEALFDRAAPVYDQLVEGDRLNIHLRKVSQRLLRQLFLPGTRVLEIGCGTGLETIPMAQTGVDVVAIDISAKMLEELNKKIRALSLRDRIESRKGSASELAAVVDEFGPGSFDGAFSHFGALNCEPHLDAVPAALHRLVKPNGRISLGILNRTCLAEMFLFTLGLRPRRALARLHSAIPFGASQFGVRVFPYGPGEVRRLFAPYFAAERTFGVSVFVPPAHLGRRFRSHPRLLSMLEAFDDSLASRPMFRNLGDYFLMELRRY